MGTDHAMIPKQSFTLNLRTVVVEDRWKNKQPQETFKQVRHIPECHAPHAWV